MNKNLHCFHGFLGLPADWDFLNIQGYRIYRWNLWDFFQGDSITNWKNLSEKIWTYLDPFKADQNDILAYSLGGRIALELIVQRPKFFQKSILISVNPGIKDHIQKIERRESDNQWAELFLTMPWEQLMQQWSQQQVFAPGGKEVQRQESQYSRSSLAKALRHFSLGYQEDYRKFLLSCENDILWVVGENDAKFVDISMELQERGASFQFWICPDAYHRVPWEQAEAFGQKIESFLKDE